MELLQHMYLILLVFVCSQSSSILVNGAVPETQVQALLTIYGVTNMELITFYKEGDGIRLPWREGTDPCQWYGVECNQSNTTVIFVDGDNLQQGELPGPEVWRALPDLETISLFKSGLDGNLSDIGAALGSLTNLTFLALWGNRLVGSLPPELADCESMTNLQLGNNFLSGPIPEDWAVWENIIELWLGNNMLTGVLPSWLATPRASLSSVVLSDNMLGGVLDLALGDFAKGVDIDVRNNFFNDTGPDDLLQSGGFDLSGNCLNPGLFESQRKQAECNAFYAPVNPPPPLFPPPPPPSSPSPPSPPSPPPPPAALPRPQSPPPSPQGVVPDHGHRGGGSSSLGIAIGAAAGGVTVFAVAVALLLFCCILPRWRKKKGAGVGDVESGEKDNDQFWDFVSMPGTSIGAGGATVFTLKDIKMATGHFAYQVGKGGFGPVYYGILKDGRHVAVKRRDEKSSQGRDEFVVEIEVLSNLARHRHLVNLVGFCCENREQILVYEYMPNGTLRDHLRPKGARPSQEHLVKDMSTAPSELASTTSITNSGASQQRGSAEALSLDMEPKKVGFFRGLSRSPHSAPGPGSPTPGYTLRSPSRLPSVPSAPGTTPSGTSSSLRGSSMKGPEPVLPIMLSWRRRLQIALGAARGVNYLHSEIPGNTVLIHRDLKPSNILLNDRLEACVADFGLAKLGQKGYNSVGDQRTAAFSTMVKGTPGFLDPEYYQVQQLTTKSDVYSFGVILLMLVTGKDVVDFEKLQSGADDWNIQEWGLPLIEAKQYMEVVDVNLDEAEMTPKSLEIFCQLTLSCLQRRGRQRPTMHEVVHRLEEALAMLPPQEGSPRQDEEGDGDQADLQGLSGLGKGRVESELWSKVNDGV